MKDNFFRSLFTDESGSSSSKRFFGAACIISLIVALFTVKDPNESIISALEYVAIALFFASSSDKAFKMLSDRKTKNKKPDEEQPK